jgi:hypothetical protein
MVQVMVTMKYIIEFISSVCKYIQVICTRHGSFSELICPETWDWFLLLLPFQSNILVIDYIFHKTSSRYC